MEAVGRMRGLDMNNAVETFPMTMPSGWRGRTSEVPAQTSVLRVETSSPADLCVMKLESGRPKDLADVREMLGRDPAIAEGASAILSDPLEVQVNLGEGAWEVVRGRSQTRPTPRRTSRTSGSKESCPARGRRRSSRTGCAPLQASSFCRARSEGPARQVA